MTEGLDLIEMQGSGEEATFSEEQMLEMLKLSKQGVTEIAGQQRAALAAFDPSK
jgi:ribonuclease PH